MKWPKKIAASLCEDGDVIAQEYKRGDPLDGCERIYTLVPARKPKKARRKKS